MDASTQQTADCSSRVPSSPSPVPMEILSQNSSQPRVPASYQLIQGSICYDLTDLNPSQGVHWWPSSHRSGIVTSMAWLSSLAQELLHAVGVAVKIQETKNPVSPGSHPHLLPGHSLPLDPGHWDALPTPAF